MSTTLEGMPTFARDRKIECLLFAAAFFAYGYFHQGGGWAQNARFAMVRAIVEEGCGGLLFAVRRVAVA